MENKDKLIVHQGLTKDQVDKSRLEHGTNAITEKELEGFFEKAIDSIKGDVAMQALIAALVANLIMLFTGTGSLADVVGVSMAIIIAITVEVRTEMKQEAKAQELRRSETEKELVKVYRDGIIHEIKLWDVVKGDAVILQAGDSIPADGILLEGDIRVDQASLNGETEEAKKCQYVKGVEYDTKDYYNGYYIYRGTVVMTGEAVMQVEVVGDSTEYGILAQEMQEDTRETPLKLKLNKLTEQITKFGMVAGLIVAGMYLLQVFVLSGVPVDGVTEVVQHFINAFGLGVVIIVMAVPEGLPMMTALVLSMNTDKMQKDNVLVEKAYGIETAGGINIQFSDKTGTITQGKPSVIGVVTGGLEDIKGNEDFVLFGLGVNNSSVVAEKSDIELQAEEKAIDIVGGDAEKVRQAKENIDKYKVTGSNSTDRAIMEYIRKLDRHIEVEDIKDGKVEDMVIESYEAFDSTKKSASVQVKVEGISKIYLKGAPEVIVANSKYYRENGEIRVLTDEKRVEVEKFLLSQANRCMRMIGVASTDELDATDTLILEGLVSIRDDVRDEAKQAISQVQQAGIQVVMVTGDIKETAVAISKEAGILNETQTVAITSQELRDMSDDDVVEILPKLAVVSRALPTDKSRLVRIAQEQNLVVGMTGDGVNDSPALKAADVGFAMGSGTAVAKAAGDITILDDNFLSIGKAILYGRTITKAIRKFIIFQLTVNVSAVAVSVLAPIFGVAQPISIVTMLYINLVMDTLAALAFGGEPALERYMQEKPIRRDESIVTRYMATQIGAMGVVVTLGSLLILNINKIMQLKGVNITPLSEIELKSVMIIYFMFTVILNGFFTRSENFNVFEDISHNKRFLYVFAGVFALLVVLVNLLGDIAGLTAVSVDKWLVIMGFSATISIVVDIIRKTIIKASTKSIS